jgi:hypothetical protein
MRMMPVGLQGHGFYATRTRLYGYYFSNRTGIGMEKLVQQINDILYVTNNSFTKTEALVSFIEHSPIFAPCKEIL